MRGRAHYTASTTAGHSDLG